MGPLRCSQDKECRKNSGETKKFYFQNSNQWDVTQVVLNVEARQCFVWSECEKRKHKKRKTDYWETENSKTKVSDDRHEVAGTSTCSTRTKIDLSKLKAKEPQKEINALGLKPKGLSKMNETQLLPLLQLQNEKHFASVLFPFNLNSPEILLPFNNRN